MKIGRVETSETNRGRKRLPKLVFGLGICVVIGLIPNQVAVAGDADSSPQISVLTDSPTAPKVRAKAPAKVITKAPKTTKRVAKRRTKVSTPVTTAAAAPPPPASQPDYTCAGLTSPPFEAAFGSDAFFQGPDARFECAFSDENSNFVVAVSKRDNRLFGSYSDGRRGDFGRASSSISRSDGRPGVLTLILLTGGREVSVSAPSQAAADQLASLVQATWPKLNPDQKRDISFGECNATTRKFTGREISPFAGDVIVPRNATPLGGTNRCTLGTEADDIQFAVFSPTENLGSPPPQWRRYGVGMDFEDFGQGLYVMLLPTKAFGLLRIQAVSAASNFNSSVVRKTDWAAQQTRVRAIADKLVAL